MMDARYFIVRSHGSEDGPFTEEEVLDLLDAGELTHADWCRIGDQPHSQPLGEVFETIRLTPEQPRDEEEVGDEDEDEDDDDDDDHDEEEDDDEDEDGDDDDDDDGDRMERPDTEEALYRGAPSFVGYGGPLGVAAGVLVLGYWAGAHGAVWIIGAVATAFLLVARVLVHRAAREYLVTTDRVESTRGLLSRETRTIRLRDLESIRLLRPWPLGWFGVGTVVFSAESGAGEDVVFERVRGVRAIIECVRKWQNRQPRV